MSDDNLEARILDTLRFFDLQSLPLTAFEVYKYLLADRSYIKGLLDSAYELVSIPQDARAGAPVSIGLVSDMLSQLLQSGKVGQDKGYYFLSGKQELVSERLRNYLNGIRRERLIRRYLSFTRHLPFIRGIALAGSQALGQERPDSDIDLLIITDHRFMWLARVILTGYFQILGLRRHGKYIANRFCLNHYLATIRPVDAERNLYKAMEYLKLRPIVYGQSVGQFQRANQSWMKLFFPNVEFLAEDNFQPDAARSPAQWVLESIFTNKLGLWIEAKLGQLQLSRIKQDKFIFVRDDELSFHPDSKHAPLLQGFFGK